MSRVTFERRDTYEVTSMSGEPETHVDITGFLDGVEVLTQRFAVDAGDSAVQEHLEWEMRRRKLI